eukprot:CAMPEP_0119012850 /NCGR_PEP_ID=MMETSP1176-20130426/7661_1 /TAXON_ID=265551 /ORGANISM="Synedropsis recta cf, Strain CCMP1620" /LENGTH=168 /DNA_ID=CAMNT_0006965885 /DNA_START=28 /DNA_END=532 /DNA_ORIENTATION=+
MSLKQNNYFSVLSTASAVLATKIALVHLASVRTRLMTDNGSQLNDDKNALGPLFKIILCCRGPHFGGLEFITRVERIAKNCAENEPFVLVMAAVGGLAGSVPVCVGVPLIKIYTAARCAHTVVFLMGDKVNTAVRAVMFTTGLFSGLGLAALASGLIGGTKGKHCGNN